MWKRFSNTKKNNANTNSRGKSNAIQEPNLNSGSSLITLSLISPYRPNAKKVKEQKNAPQ